MVKRVLIIAVLLLPVAARAADSPPPAEGGRPPAQGGVSLFIESADLRAVVTALAEAHNVNVVGTDKLAGSVTVRLVNAPVLVALHAILRNAGFELVESEGGIYKILTREEAAKAELARQELRVQIVPIRFADPKEVAKLLAPSAIPDAKDVTCDATSNQLIITGTDEQMRRVQQIVAAVDVATPQVMIEARIVEVLADKAEALGAKLKLGHKFDGASGDPKEAKLLMDLTQATTQAATLGLNFSCRFIDAALSSLVQHDAAEVLSAPKVTTGHNRRAEIKVTDQVPVITRTTRIVDQVTVTDETVTFQETGLTLTVVPRVLSDQRIEMAVEPSVRELTGYTDTDPPAPIIDTRSAKTMVTIENGRWLVIGGLMRYREERTERGIPILKDLPLVGWFFRTSRTTREKRNLVIFLSATVLDPPTVEREVNRQHSEIDGYRDEGVLQGGPFAPPHPLQPKDN